MNTTIKIKVIAFPDGSEKVYYQNSVILPDSVSFPYESVCKVLRLLYPSASMVQFTVG